MGIAEVILKVTDRASGELRKVADEGKKTDKAIEGLVTGLAATGAGLLAVGGAGLAFAQQMADMQNDISDMSARTGVATDTLSAMRVMAEATGRQFEDLNEVINPLVARMGQVAAGNEAIAKKYADLGIEIVDTSGKMRSTDAVLRDIMGTLTDIEDPTERAAAAVALLGESGGKLVQIMGAGEFDAFADFVAEFGTDTGPAAAAAAAEWQVATALLSETVRGALSEFAGIETATELVVQLAGAVAFVAESFKALLAFPGEFLERLSQSISMAFDLMNTLAAKMLEVLPDSRLFAAQRAQLEAVAALGAEGAFQFRQERGEGQQFDPFAAREELIAGFRDVLSATTGAGGGGLDVTGALGATAAEKAATDAAKAEAKRQETARKEMMKRIKDWTDEQQKAAEEAAKAAEAAQQAAEAARQAAFEMSQTVLGMAQQALTGDIGGLVGSVGALAGPAGMIAAQVVQGIEAIGQLGAAGVEAKLDEFQANILAGLKALPEIIGKVLPEFIAEFVPALIVGLVEALPELLLAQVEAFARLIVAQFRDIPMAIAEGLTTAFLNVWDRIKEFFQALFTGRFKEAFGTKKDRTIGQRVGRFGRVLGAIGTLGASELAIAVGKGIKKGTEGRSFARGGVVDRTGLAMVHQGERFTREDGSMSGTTRAAMGRGGGGGVVINVSGFMTLRDLTEAMRRELGDRGSGLSLDPFTA